MNEVEIRKIVEHTLSQISKNKIEQKFDKTKITLSVAEKICDAVFKKSKEMGVKAVVCVSDSGGHPVLVKRMDDAFIASYDIAVNKAYTVVALKTSTKALKPLAQPGEALYGIQFTNQGKIVIFGGGETLTDDLGNVIGGLGVSGGTEEQDTELSRIGKEFFDKIQTNI